MESEGRMNAERRMELLDELADSLEGTCDNIGTGISRLTYRDDITVEEIEEMREWDDDDLLDVNLEQCSDCGWWERNCSPDEENDDAPLCAECFNRHEMEGADGD